MQFRKIGLRSVALILCLLLVSATGSMLTAGAASLSDQIASLERKQSAIKSEIADLKKDISKKQELKTALQKQINNVQDQIDLYNSEISGLNNKINALEAEVEETQNNLDESKAAFKGRLKAMYVSGNNSALSLLLSADDFGDFLYKSELMRSVTEYDTVIIEQLKADIEKLEARLERAGKQKGIGQGHEGRYDRQAE